MDKVIKLFKYCFIIENKLSEILYRETRLIESYSLIDTVEEIYLLLNREFKTNFIDLLYVRKLD